MNDQPEHVRQFLAICWRMYQRMEREGTWAFGDLDAPPLPPTSRG
ncbi:hypothetical protein [Salaquimonas pukyongi]|nr:hypothetical protein [Salaquimonas pukyongi]